MKEDVTKAIYESIKTVANKFQKEPYYFLYERDIHCDLYLNLMTNYNHKMNLKWNTGEGFTSNAIHSDPYVGTNRNNLEKADLLIYHTLNPVKILYSKQRRIYFSKEDSEPRTLIEIKFNRSSKGLRSKNRSAFLKDINKRSDWKFQKAYFLLFDRSGKIDEKKYKTKFVDKIVKLTTKNHKLIVIYIGNKGVRQYSEDKITNI